MNTEQIQNISIEDLLQFDSFPCECGKHHSTGTKRLVVESGAIAKLPQLLREFGITKPFLLSGKQTFAAAGDRVLQVLEHAGIPYSRYVFPESPVLPTEHSVGSAVMHFDDSCDAVIGIGSGVINDIGKILARISGRAYFIVATAPSMDGYASATSSMERDGLKVSLDSTYALAIIGDLDVLCQAPLHMIHAGIGDMLAKYVSLCEWQIASLLLGEYYCPAIAQLVKVGLQRCIDAVPALARRDPAAVKAVMDGMVITGIAMNYAGLSRPASGMEHYFSHIWDMRGLAFDTQTDLHGIQCGIATLYCLKIYDYIRTIVPNRQKALDAAAGFSIEKWNQQLRTFIGPGADAMIRSEQKDGKYDPAKHALRLEAILANWQQILTIVNAMPRYADLSAFMQNAGIPVSASEFGVTGEDVRTSFTMTKDIRDKYIGSRLLWDLGLLDEAAALLP